MVADCNQLQYICIYFRRAFMSSICAHREMSGTCRYLEMARTFILAVCAIALLISVQQASAGMLPVRQSHHRASLRPSYMAACLLSRVLHVRSASGSGSLRRSVHMRKHILCQRSVCALTLLPFLTPTLCTDCRWRTPAQRGAS